MQQFKDGDGDLYNVFHNAETQQALVDQMNDAQQAIEAAFAKQQMQEVSRQEIDPQALCPCESGEIYIECCQDKANTGLMYKARDNDPDPPDEPRKRKHKPWQTKPFWRKR